MNHRYDPSPIQATDNNCPYSDSEAIRHNAFANLAGKGRVCGSHNHASVKHIGSNVYMMLQTHSDIE